MKKLCTLILIVTCTNAFAQQLGNLTVEKIMRDPKWIGTSPSNVRWSDDSKKIYFDWNPKNVDRDELYSVSTSDIKPQKVGIEEQIALPPSNGAWNKKHTVKLFEKNGDIFLSDIVKGKILRLTGTTDRESNPVFSGDEGSIIFTRGNNLYALKLNGGELKQLTNFVRLPQASRTKSSDAAPDAQQKWLRTQQLELFDAIKEKAKNV